MNRLPGLCVGLVATALSGAAWSQGAAGNFPSRAVTLISPTAAGGPIDTETRLYAKKMTEYLGQPFILDYKVGGGITIGTSHVAKSAPDGYTLLVTNASFTLVTALYKDLPFDPIRDFAPVSMMSQRVTVLTTYPSFAAKHFSDYIAMVKARPGAINFGTTGPGTATHMAGAWMNTATGTHVTFVHYKGVAQVILDLIAQRIEAAPVSLVIALPQIRAGKLRPLAIMNNQRSNLLPGVMTIAEQGIPDYNYVNWMGFFAPGATPATVVSKLSENFARAAKSPEVVAASDAEGNIQVGSTAAQFRQVIIEESARWKKLVADVGIKLEQ